MASGRVPSTDNTRFLDIPRLYLLCAPVCLCYISKAMESVATILKVLQALSGLTVIGLVLLHSPKGDGLGAIGGSAQLFSSQPGAEAALNKVTAYAVGVFFVASFILGYYF